YHSCVLSRVLWAGVNMKRIFLALLFAGLWHMPVSAENYYWRLYGASGQLHESTKYSTPTEVCQRVSAYPLSYESYVFKSLIKHSDDTYLCEVTVIRPGFPNSVKTPFKAVRGGS